jgi:hypothetical protein
MIIEIEGRVAAQRLLDLAWLATPESIRTNLAERYPGLEEEAKSLVFQARRKACRKFLSAMGKTGPRGVRRRCLALITNEAGLALMEHMSGLVEGGYYDEDRDGSWYDLEASGLGQLYAADARAADVCGLKELAERLWLRVDAFNQIEERGLDGVALAARGSA